MEFSCSGQCHNNRGVGSCFQEELGSPVQVGPAEVCATPAFPKPCQASSAGWAEECQGSTGVSWVFLVVLHPTGLLCRTGGCPTGGCLCAEAAGFTPGVTWAVAMEELMGLSAQLFWATVGTSSGGWQVRLHPAPSGWCWEDVACMEEQEEAAPVSLGSRLSFMPGWDSWPSVLSVGMRRLSQPASRPWVWWGLVWLQDVWHLVVDPRIPWDRCPTLLNVCAHPAHAGLKVGTASVEQH